ncbi:hypothetical protein RQCS_58390 (plasmid) [Rhodococcus qingshengii]|nr:hypothetical protein RQCS_58390 [Rhodococcus qingshengii]
MDCSWPERKQKVASRLWMDLPACDEPDADDETGFRIARYKISCCAADVVRVIGATGSPPSVDQWVTVTGTFRPSTGDPSTGGSPELLASSLAEISLPPTLTNSPDERPPTTNRTHVGCAGCSVDIGRFYLSYGGLLWEP